MCVDMRVDMCVHTPFENSRRECRMEPPAALAHARLDTAFGDADVVLIARLARARSCVPLAPASPIVFCACSVVPHPDPTTNESRGRGHRHANIVMASRGSAMLKIASRMPSIAFCGSTALYTNSFVDRRRCKLTVWIDSAINDIDDNQNYQ